MNGEQVAAVDLSVVVVVVSDTVDRTADATLLAGALEALAQQREAPTMEIIVPYHAATRGVDNVRERFPAVRFIAVDDAAALERERAGREHHDRLRARGLAAARGKVVALLEDHGRPDVDWAHRMVAAHRSAHAAVGGAMGNEVNRALNWAVYFCDFGRYQNPIPSGNALTVSDANVSYKREALERFAPVWRDAFREPSVNSALTSAGLSLFLEPGAVVNQNRGSLSLATALRERYVWARSYAVERAGRSGILKRLAYAGITPVLPALLTLRMGASVMKKRAGITEFVRALPYTLMLTASWAAGEAAGYLTGAVPDATVSAKSDE